VKEVDVPSPVTSFMAVAHPKYPSVVRLCTGTASGAILLWDTQVRPSLLFISLHPKEEEKGKEAKEEVKTSDTCVRMPQSMEVLQHLTNKGKARVNTVLWVKETLTLWSAPNMHLWQLIVPKSRLPIT